MSVLAQCGFGPGAKVVQGIESEVIAGLIKSPRDQRRERIESEIQELVEDNEELFVLFDPQFYAANLDNPRDGHLSEFAYYDNNCGLGRTQFSATNIQKYVQECLEYQHDTFGDMLSRLISPNISFDDFRDSWSQISLNMASESLEYHLGMENPEPLLISVIVSDTAFRDMSATDEFLDALTELDVDGFYLIMQRSSTSSPNAVDASSLARFMYFCHVLAGINEYEVVVGYCDWHGFLLEAVGVDFTASGWYQNLRQFSLARYLPSRGGRRPRKRYSSEPLLSSLLITPELQDVSLAGMIDLVLSGSEHDSILENGPTSGEANWSAEISCLAHWYSLDALSQQVSHEVGLKGKIDEAEQIIGRALTLYNQLGSNGITFDPTTGPSHLVAWQESIREFRSLIGI